MLHNVIDKIAPKSNLQLFLYKMSKAILLFIDTVAHLDNCIRLLFAFYINKHDMF